FDTDGFEAYLIGEGIPWPRTPTGRLSTRSEVFEEMADIYPVLRPLCELRSALNQLKDDGGLSVGKGGRNRSSLRPFATSSGRNAPSTTKFVFGKSVAFRSLIQPDPGWAISYLDWSWLAPILWSRRCESRINRYRCVLGPAEALRSRPEDTS